MNSITIIGNGWLGNACALYLSEKKYKVKVTNRTIHHTSEFFENYSWSLGESFPKNAVSDIIIISLAERENNFDNYLKLYRDLEKYNVQKIIFISSTSVYTVVAGNCTESLELKISADNIVALKEETLKSTEIKHTILRLAGLVGENRYPARFLAGKKDVANPNHKVNLVHQLDVIRFIEICICLDLFGVYNVCSTYHPSRKEFYTEVCELANLQAPEFTSDKGDDRWIDNSKSKKEGNFVYLYDDLLEYYRSSSASDIRMNSNN